MAFRFQLAALSWLPLLVVNAKACSRQSPPLCCPKVDPWPASCSTSESCTQIVPSSLGKAPML
ncbi:hypothetical protein PF005_g8130 [Phytophthora fragariae]|uniref:Uncharacterized protein n=2 Tax=Phytophthora TaxID=4783 RepID=A0A6A3YIF0_9STRA|nr:hypothetical protein PF003_g7699 [Phytophthora fragariae]KAE9021781.1 hypothetical protein PR002_g12154 [Phytophthora rubi]KAE8941757.1 hypothetical protein PF009_g8467 [Phytophthora fragariae]KAE8999827.1 hypothetical protein PF011_g14459 [Phytophthora fragariae]KAE9028159.1 hypothetical protein PR001_g11799 [Phytophthora rubi]